jgi:hypothetical protein
MLYHAFFGCTWGAVPWVYAAEINSLTWRTRGAAAATATNWLGGFVVVQLTKLGIDDLGWAFYLSELNRANISILLLVNAGKHLLTRKISLRRT